MADVASLGNLVQLIVPAKFWNEGSGGSSRSYQEQSAYPIAQDGLHVRLLVQDCGRDPGTMACIFLSIPLPGADYVTYFVPEKCYFHG